MNGILFFLGAMIIVSFSMGYSLRRFTLKLESKADSAELQAELKSEQLEATVDASLDGIIIIDGDGRVVQFSKSAERIFGYKEKELIGKDMSTAIIAEGYREAHNKDMSRMRETGQANILGQRIEIEARRANGEEFMSEVAISRSRNSSGDTFIAYIRDISEAKAAEEALRKAKDAAELANKSKTQFISAMSHEIRTPFNAVLGILDILGDTKLTTDQKQLVQTAEKTSQGLLRIINDVLDYARISSGSVKIVNEAFHAPDVFDDVYQLFEMTARDRKIDFKINTTQADKIHLSGDIGRIRQILMNYVSNAIKYTNDGSVELIVETFHAGDGIWNLMCKVKDSGQGIKESKLNRLFEEFYMAEDVDIRASKGTGLGLTICKTLSKLMGATLGVESKLGEGSTFWFNIPLQKVEAVSTSEEVSLETVNIKGKRILLAEDNTTNRMVVSRTLEKQGVSLTQATNGIEALSFLKICNFDLLLTDVFMPEMGGKELVERLRRQNSPNSNIPVIALTAMGDIHEAEELISFGVDQVILKPFNSKDLISAIAQLCENHQKSEMRPDKLEIKMNTDLLEGLDSEDLLVIKEQFKIDLQDTTNALRDAIKRKDMEATRFSSHTLKGLSAIYGLKLLSEVASLTNSHCHPDTLREMLEHGTRAIQLADAALFKIDDLFENNEEAA